MTSDPHRDPGADPADEWDTPASDPVNHPAHYISHPSGIECIQITEHMNFCRGNAIKYLWRAGEKGTELDDLRKARWYIDREITRLTPPSAVAEPVTPPSLPSTLDKILEATQRVRELNLHITSEPADADVTAVAQQIARAFGERVPLAQASKACRTDYNRAARRVLNFLGPRLAPRNTVTP